MAPLAQVDAAGTITYLHTDELGSVRAPTNSATTLVGTASFDPAGNVVAKTALSIPLGWAGQHTRRDRAHLSARSSLSVGNIPKIQYCGA